MGMVKCWKLSQSFLKSFLNRKNNSYYSAIRWSQEPWLQHWQNAERIGMYTYKAEITRVIDGDTVDAFVDCGFKHYTMQRFRLAAIDCPEMNTEAGKLAKAWLIKYFSDNGNRCVIESKKSDSFGRWLAFIRVKGVLVNDELIKSGNAVKYLKR